MGYYEQFIQDAAAKGCRLERIVQELLGKKSWKFCTNGEIDTRDIVFQEYSFIGGRIDILATFNNRKKLLIIEVKCGEADAGAVRQIKAYLNLREDFQEFLTEEPSNNNVAGIVLAEGFSNLSKSDLANTDLSLILFNLSKDSFPFTLYDLTNLPDTSEERRPIKRVRKSYLDSFESHQEWILSDFPLLRKEFADIANCFLDSITDKNKLSWLIINPTSSHVGIRYKGEWVICLWVYRKWFRFGYYSPDEWVVDNEVREQDGKIVYLNYKRDVLDRQAVISAIKKRIENLDREIDTPGTFTWFDE